MVTEFYNHEQKELYLAARESENHSIRDVCKIFFNITKKYEEALGKDCCNFTSKEILNMYSCCATRSWEQLLNFNSQLKIYTGWCLLEGLVRDNQNHYEELDKYDMYKCLNLAVKKKMYITRKELEKTIQKFPNPSDQFMVLAFFEGIGGLGYKDFVDLMPSQFVDNKVILADRELTVSPLLTAKALESANEYDKYSYEGKKKVGYRKDDPSVFKDSANIFDDDPEARNKRKIQRRYAALEKEFGKAFSYVALHNSGRIDMIKRLMAEDGSTDPRETFEKHKEEIELRYGKLQRVQRWLEENEDVFKLSK